MKTNFPFLLVSGMLFLMVPSGPQRHCQAQSFPLFKSPAHTLVSTMPWWDSIYRFPDFQYGKITFMTGFSPENTSLMNYNLYYGQMDFINGKGDTLQITPSKELKLVEIGSHLFFHDDRAGYIEIIIQAPVSLGVLRILNTEKMVFVDGSPAPFRVDMRGTFSDYDRYYRQTNTYFFVDAANKLRKAIRPSILKLFHTKKKEIKAYLDSHAINFTIEEDLVKLIDFCNGTE